MALEELAFPPEIRPNSHFRVKQLSDAWGFSRNTITRLIDDDPDILALSNEGSGKRVYNSRSIPKTAALRLYERLRSGNLGLKRVNTVANPFRVKFFSDSNAPMPKKPLNVMKLKASQKLANSKGIA